jgi:xylulokinase
MNIPITEVRASGGGARSEFWRQLQADIYNAPIVLTNASEGPAYGVAILAAVGTGAFSNVQEACRASIKRTQKIPPNKKRAAQYEPFYRAYDRLYPTLKPNFHDQAGLCAVS